MYSGNLLLLKLKVNGEWLDIGGVQTTQVEVNRELVDYSNISSSWRELIGNGIKYINISLSGIFSNSEAEQKITKLAFNGELGKYKLLFANGENWEGKFQISKYQRFGDVDEEERYSMSISSSGEILI